MDWWDSESSSETSSDEGSDHATFASEAIQPTQLEDPKQTFERAIADFKTSLPNGNRIQIVECQTAKSMIKSIETLVNTFKNQSKVSRLLACCNRIANFALVWEPFFEITSIFVSSNPEYAAFAWGAIRLVFLLGTNFVTFLEKLTSMFDGMRSTLSLHQRHIERIRENPFRTDGLYLSKALSYIYTDVIEFCQNSSAVFIRRGPNALQTLKVATSLFWKPFDARFTAIQKRLASHESLFEGELYLQDQQALNRYFQLFESKLHTEMETSRKEKEKGKKNAEKRKRRKEHRRRRKDEALKQAQAEKLKRQIQDIKLWCNAPSFMEAFETVRRTRYPGTCTWLLENSRYISWRDTCSTKEGTFMSRLLSIEANPGFGKTVLSIVAIENLMARKSSETFVSFFHFGSDERAYYFQAYRAVTTNLIHQGRKNHEIIDLATIAMDQDGSGQFHASDDEVEELLGLLLHKFSVTLVFDGVDECVDIDGFLCSLFELCKGTDTKILLLSRPISFPANYQTRKEFPWRLRLDSENNFHDIRLFLSSNLTKFFDKGSIYPTDSREKLLDNLAKRSNGMFLWAKLMITYISCSAISPAERLHALQEANMLEGLEKMYGRILQVIGSRYVREKLMVFKVLNWILVSARSMSVEEMRTALAIQPGIPTSEGAYLVEFEETLSVSSIGLLECKLGRVQFIHSSVREFLCTADLSNTTFRVMTNEANISLASASLSYLANDLPTLPLSCYSDTAANHMAQPGFSLPAPALKPLRSMNILATLSISVPELASISEQQRLPFTATESPTMNKPYRSNYHQLQGTSFADTAIDEAWRLHRIGKLDQGYNFWSREAEIEERFPFLRYAANFWHDHAFKSLIGYPLPLTSTTFASCAEFLALLSTFLLDMNRVTTWVEGSCIFGFLPNLADLVVPMSRLGVHNLPPGVAQREFKWTCKALNRLSLALKQLYHEKFTVLLTTPAAIWGQDISAATDPQYWPIWEPTDKDEQDDFQDDNGLGVVSKYVSSY